MTVHGYHVVHLNVMDLEALPPNPAALLEHLTHVLRESGESV
jgi:hypothetical protein